MKELLQEFKTKRAAGRYKRVFCFKSEKLKFFGSFFSFPKEIDKESKFKLFLGHH